MMLSAFFQLLDTLSMIRLGLTADGGYSSIARLTLSGIRTVYSTNVIDC